MLMLAVLSQSHEVEIQSSDPTGTLALRCTFHVDLVIVLSLDTPTQWQDCLSASMDAAVRFVRLEASP